MPLQPLTYSTTPLNVQKKVLTALHEPPLAHWIHLIGGMTGWLAEQSSSKPTAFCPLVSLPLPHTRRQNVRQETQGGRRTPGPKSTSQHRLRPGRVWVCSTSVNTMAVVANKLGDVTITPRSTKSPHNFLLYMNKGDQAAWVRDDDLRQDLNMCHKRITPQQPHYYRIPTYIQFSK